MVVVIQVTFGRYTITAEEPTFATARQSIQKQAADLADEIEAIVPKLRALAGGGA